MTLTTKLLFAQLVVTVAGVAAAFVFNNVLYALGAFLFCILAPALFIRLAADSQTSQAIPKDENGRE